MLHTGYLLKIWYSKIPVSLIQILLVFPSQLWMARLVVVSFGVDLLVV